MTARASNRLKLPWSIDACRSWLDRSYYAWPAEAPRHAIGGWPSHIEEPELLFERAGESGDKLDQIGLAVNSGFLVDPAQVGSHGRCGNAEHLCGGRHAADLHDCEKHPELGERQRVRRGNKLG